MFPLAARAVTAAPGATWERTAQVDPASVLSITELPLVAYSVCGFRGSATKLAAAVSEGEYSFSAAEVAALMRTSVEAPALRCAAEVTGKSRDEVVPAMERLPAESVAAATTLLLPEPRN